jgi:RNA polymerase sigma factor (sigma-70 family)
MATHTRRGTGLDVSKSRESDLDLPELASLVRRIAARRLKDHDAVEDVVQETITRLLEVRDRLDQRVLTTYAAITARNLILSASRRRDVERRRAPRLFDPREPDRPDESVLRAEDNEAVAAALAHLSVEDRRLVVEHDAWGTPTAALGRASGRSPGAVATRLARLRAELRLDYGLALRRTTLPTDRCRSVLLAISAHDRKRQRAVDAAAHLVECDVCASLSEPLLSRSRVLAPAIVTWQAVKQLASTARAHPAQAAVATTVTAAAVAGGLWLADSPPPPPERSRPALVVEGEPVFSATGRPRLARHEGGRVRASGVNVLTVPSDEGFWVGRGKDRRVWVLLRGGGESPFEVTPGQALDFVGRIRRNSPHLLRRLQLGPGEGSADLRRQGYHITVDQRKLELR